MTTNRSNEPHTTDACNDCTLVHARRDFLRTMAGAALASVGLAPSAHALAVRLENHVTRRGELATYPVPAAEGVTIDTNNEVILVRTHEHIYPFALACPHQNTALKWQASDHRFQCPKHKSKYTADGVYIEGRATRSMDRYAVRLDGKNIVVNLDKLYEEDQDVVLWQGAFIAV